MNRPLIIIGGGEHARVIMEAATQNAQWEILGFTDSAPRPETTRLYGVPYLGTDDDIPHLTSQYPHASFVIGVGKNLMGREKITRRVNIPKERWATIIHPSAHVSPKAVIEEGVVVLYGSMIQTGAVVKRHAIINSNCLVEHDVSIDEFSHLCPGVITGGGVEIGSSSLIGIGAKIRDHIHIGNHATVGTGAVVVHDIPDKLTVVGIPARPIDKGKINNIYELCVRPNTTLYETMAVIGKFGALTALVTDEDNRLLGIVTDGDVRRAILSKTNLDCAVEKVMNRNFASAPQGMSRLAALDKMRSLAINQLPVVDGENHVVGLHFISDFVGNIDSLKTAIVLIASESDRQRNNDKVFLEQALENVVLFLTSHEIRSIYFMNIRDNFDVKKCLGEKFFGCEIHELRIEREQHVTSSIASLTRKLDHTVLIMNIDTFNRFDLEGMHHHHRASKDSVTIGAYRHTMRFPYNMLEMEGKRPSRVLPSSGHFILNSEIYLASPSLFKGPIDMDTSWDNFIQHALSSKQNIGVYFLKETFPTWRNFDLKHEAGG